MDADEGDITFISSAKYLKQASESKASCIIVKEPIPDIKKQYSFGNPKPLFLLLQRRWNVFIPDRLFSEHKREGDSFQRCPCSQRPSLFTPLLTCLMTFP